MAAVASTDPALPRSVQWRAWLGVLSGPDSGDWTRQAQARRQAYAAMLLRFTAAPVSDDDDLQINNPLSQHQHSSWSRFFRSAELQSTIDLDLVRTHPTKPFFQSAQTQAQMRNILFVWAQLHPRVSYRQGMNELLSPIILSRSNDAGAGHASGDIRLLTDAAFVEHDAFAVFEALMSNMADLFISEPAADADTQRPAIVARSEYVQNVLLRDVDAELYAHLAKVGVQPQLYGLRWLRLLLAREFHLDHVFVIWDAIFRAGAGRAPDVVYALPFVDHVCVAMLQFVRRDLLAGDHSACIRRLLSYPPVEDISVLLVRAERLIRGEKPSGIGSFVFVPHPIEPEPEQGGDGHRPEQSAALRGAVPGALASKTPDSRTGNELLGDKLDNLVAVMQREIRKGQLECDQGVLLQCLAKIKLIKDVLLGNLSFESVADDIKVGPDPLLT